MGEDNRYCKPQLSGVVFKVKKKGMILTYIYIRRVFPMKSNRLFHAYLSQSSNLLKALSVPVYHPFAFPAVRNKRVPRTPRESNSTLKQRKGES